MQAEASAGEHCSGVLQPAEPQQLAAQRAPGWPRPSAVRSRCTACRRRRHVARSAHLFSWARSFVLCSFIGADMARLGRRSLGPTSLGGKAVVQKQGTMLRERCVPWVARWHVFKIDQRRAKGEGECRRAVRYFVWFLIHCYITARLRPQFAVA